MALKEENVDVERSRVERTLKPEEADKAFGERTVEVTATTEKPVVSKQAHVVEEVALSKQSGQREETVSGTVRRQDVKVEESTRSRDLPGSHEAGELLPENAAEELMMPDDMGKGTPRKEARDAAGEMARTIRDADAGRKSVRDAAEASREASRSGGEAIRQTAERASETASRIASDAADASQQMAKRSAEQFDQMFTRQIEASQEVTRHAQQNLDVLMQVGGVLAGGFQSILREWADYAQSAARRNVDGVNSLMRARTLQDLASAQSDLLASELHLLLDSSVRISEATARLARDAAQGISDRTQQAQRRL